MSTLRSIIDSGSDIIHLNQSRVHKAANIQAASINGLQVTDRPFFCPCDGCTPFLGISAGGPGSGCNPDVGVCGRPAGHEGEHGPSVDQAVAKKFERYEKMVKAVADKKITGLAVFGERGIGKSKTVIDTIAKMGKEDNVMKVKGTITPLELFNTLSANRGPNNIVWFDDADSAFKDTTSLNILKAALDSDEPREISWLTSSNKVDEPTFRFQGRIIVTTNINLDSNEHVAALVDRMHWINLKLNAEEKMHRIEQVAPKMLSNLPEQTAKDVVGWIKDNKDKIGDNLSLRTVKKVGDLASFDDDWKDLASNMISDMNKVSGKETSTRDISKALEGKPDKEKLATEPKAPKVLGIYPSGSARQIVHDILKDGKPHTTKELETKLGVKKADKLKDAIRMMTKRGNKGDHGKIRVKNGAVQML